MFKNYIKTAFRNILRNKTFSMINIFGLSFSLAVCLIIIMLVADQMSMDRHIIKADKIFRINTQSLHDNSGVNTRATTPLAIGQELKENYTGIVNQVRIRRGFGNGWVGMEDDNSIPLGGFYADASVLDLFEYELESGDAKTALKDPYSVVITQKAANKLFGDENAMGEIIDMGEIGDYKVTGVLQDNSNKSHIVFEALASMSTTDILERDSTIYSANNNWDYTSSGWVYIEVTDPSIKSDILGYLNEIDNKYYGENELVDYKFHLQNLLEINPGPFLGNQIGPFMPLIFVYALSGLALIIMVSACFNYTNLSIAKSLSRAKEVGIRKVSGAFKNQIFSQFIVEAIIISTFSLMIAYFLVLLIEPAFKSLMIANLLRWDFSFNWQVMVISILFSITVGFFAGLFPAAVLSSFQPIKVLKDLSNIRMFSKMGMKKVLLTSQLALSLFFILSVIILQRQLDLMVTADKGFTSESMVNIQLLKTDGENLKNELLKHPLIESVTLASHIPASGISRSEYFVRNIGDDRLAVNYFSVDEDYLDQMNIKLVAGRNILSEANKLNETEILINEKAVSVFQFENNHDALGKVIYTEDSIELSIAGIVADYHHQMMVSEISPLAIRHLPSMLNYAHVKINDVNIQSSLKQVEAAWATINPSKNIQYKILDDEINEFYEFTFGDLTKVITVFSILALSVASLGLLGMAIYTTETRMKEISIRKVLGASNGNVIYILTNTFIKLMIIAIVVAVPLSYVANNLWLESIAYRIDITTDIILLGTFIMLFIGAITIGSQTLRASNTNPVDNLKND